MIRRITNWIAVLKSSRFRPFIAAGASQRDKTNIASPAASRPRLLTAQIISAQQHWIAIGLLAATPALAATTSPATQPTIGDIHFLDSAPPIPSLLPLFGGPELNPEIIPVLNDPTWTKTWLTYCQRTSGRAYQTYYYARLPAYDAYMEHDPNLAARAWTQFLHGPESKFGPERFTSHRVAGPEVAAPIDEINSVSTNDTSQWCLNAIELLQFIGDQAPETAK